jgi:threonine dehydrogenase-like Zn-dependent dehydrogenase
LFDHAKLAPDQTVLIHGAAGNVGAYAVQFARMARARVIATASAGDIDYVYGLGADEVIDFRASRFEDGLDPVNVAIDLVGGDVQRRSLSVPNDYKCNKERRPQCKNGQSRSTCVVSQKLIVVRTPHTAAFGTVPLPDGSGTPPPGCQASRTCSLRERAARG